MSTTVSSGTESMAEQGAGPRHASAWLAVILLIVGLGSGVVLGRVTKTEPARPADLAPPGVSTMIRNQIDAVNSGDTKRIAPFYAENSTLTDIGNKYAVPVHGGAEIAKALAGDVRLFGPFVEMPRTMVQRGTFVAYASSWGDVAGGVVVFELGRDGKILNQWAIHPAE